MLFERKKERKIHIESKISRLGAKFVLHFSHWIPIYESHNFQATDVEFLLDCVTTGRSVLRRQRRVFLLIGKESEFETDNLETCMTFLQHTGQSQGLMMEKESSGKVNWLNE